MRQTIFQETLRTETSDKNWGSGYKAGEKQLCKSFTGKNGRDGGAGCWRVITFLLFAVGKGADRKGGEGQGLRETAFTDFRGETKLQQTAYRTTERLFHSTDCHPA